MIFRSGASKTLCVLVLLILPFLDASAGNRGEKPWIFRFSAGNPAPSFVGGGMGYHFQDLFEVGFNMGMGWYDEINIQTFSANSRFYFFSSAISPFVGGGGSILKVRGSGSIQGLDESGLLGHLSGGVDINFDPVRLSGGLFFHFPIRLIFPFVDLGIAF